MCRPLNKCRSGRPSRRPPPITTPLAESETVFILAQLNPIVYSLIPTLCVSSQIIIIIIIRPIIITDITLVEKLPLFNEDVERLQHFVRPPSHYTDGCYHYQGPDFAGGCMARGQH